MKCIVDERGQIAVDFLLGISLFLIALIFTVQLIPGMFISGPARESSLDYTAYRTATVLTEDTGWWANTSSSGSGTDWESHTNNVLRLGLAVDDDNSSRLTNSPNMLSRNKTIQMMTVDEDTLITKLGLYNNVDDTIFSNGYNISITKDDEPIVLNGTRICRGDPIPEDMEVSKITRIVLMETGSFAEFNATRLPIDPYIAGVENTIINVTGPLEENVTIHLNNLNITGANSSFNNLILNSTVLNEGSDYVSYQIKTDGSKSPLAPTGKIDNDSIVQFIIEPGLFNTAHTYQLEIDMEDINFTATAPPYPEYTENIEIYYEHAYLKVEVWQ